MLRIFEHNFFGYFLGTEYNIILTVHFLYNELVFILLYLYTMDQKLWGSLIGTLDHHISFLR